MGRLGGHDGAGGRLGLGFVAVDLDGLVEVLDAAGGGEFGHARFLDLPELDLRCPLDGTCRVSAAVISSNKCAAAGQRWRSSSARCCSRILSTMASRSAMACASASRRGQLLGDAGAVRARCWKVPGRYRRPSRLPGITEVRKPRQRSTKKETRGS